MTTLSPDSAGTRDTYWKLAGLFCLIILTFAALYFFSSNSLQSSGKLHLPSGPCAPFLDCLYFSVITITTLGYGDIHPVGIGRVIASLETIVGVVFAGYAVSEISRLALEDRMAKRITEKLRFEFERVDTELKELAVLWSKSPITGPITEADATDAAEELIKSMTRYRSAQDRFIADPLQSVLLDSPVRDLNKRLKEVEGAFYTHVSPVHRMLTLLGDNCSDIRTAACKALDLQFDKSSLEEEQVNSIKADIGKRYTQARHAITAARQTAATYGYVDLD